MDSVDKEDVASSSLVSGSGWLGSVAIMITGELTS
jgi:hypothetical protein